MTTHEALFTDDDRDEQVALDVEESLTHRCGMSLDETTDPRYPYTYEVDEHVCAACEELELAEKERWGKSGKPPGAFLTVRESDERVPEHMLPPPRGEG